MKYGIWTCVLLSMCIGSAVRADVVLPVTGGTTPGSAYENIGPFFDAQPTSVPTAGPTTDDFGVAGGFYYNDGRSAYFDFGEDWADLTVTEVWLGLKLNGEDPNGVDPTPLFWSADLSMTYDPGAGDTLAPNFGMWSWTGNTGEKSWQQIFSGSTAVGNRYYIMDFTGTQSIGNRVQEIVFVGVPEPATMGLLVIGGIALLKRRR